MHDVMTSNTNIFNTETSFNIEQNKNCEEEVLNI
jgi:hypothetical protein